MHTISSRVVLIVGLLISASAAGAQQSTAARDSTRAGRSTAGADSGRVAVRIFAEASAREIHFAKQPELHVRLAGGLDSIHVLERRNLPSPIAVGRTYRDVYVAVEIFGRINADCITRQLLGERGAARDTSATRRGVSADCASLEVRGAGARPPNDTGSSTRR